MSQVEDNWRAISEPQRFNILKSKDPVVQILKSFQTVLLHIEDVERVTEASRVESQLNNLEISPLQTMGSRQLKNKFHIYGSFRN